MASGTGQDAASRPRGHRVPLAGRPAGGRRAPPSRVAVPGWVAVTLRDVPRCVSARRVSGCEVRVRGQKPVGAGEGSVGVRPLRARQAGPAAAATSASDRARRGRGGARRGWRVPASRPSASVAEREAQRRPRCGRGPAAGRSGRRGRAPPVRASEEDSGHQRSPGPRHCYPRGLHARRRFQ